MNYNKCGLTEYLMQHDKLMHAMVIVLGVIVVIKLFDMLITGFNFKEFVRIILSKILILIICIFAKIIDFLTISNDLLYDCIITFYIFESTCEVFLIGKDYGLPLPSKLQELIEKYIVK